MGFNLAFKGLIEDNVSCWFMLRGSIAVIQKLIGLQLVIT